jgi:hypothetical protein
MTLDIVQKASDFPFVEAEVAAFSAAHGMTLGRAGRARGLNIRTIQNIESYSLNVLITPPWSGFNADYAASGTSFCRPLDKWIQHTRNLVRELASRPLASLHAPIRCQN